MKHDAINLVTIALRKRLDAALLDNDIPGNVFVGPVTDPNSSSAPLTLFLYRLAPNASLRNSERRVPSDTPTRVDVFRTSLSLDLYYMITAGSATSSTPLTSLGIVIQALQADPEIRGEAVNHELVRTTLDPLSTEEISRLWALFPNVDYRTTIAYLASPVWIDPAQPETNGTPVIDGEFRSGTKVTEDPR
ncbi:DUF4255 domain-containing protein [Gimesia fumaroli]|uniref:Pvc16 N-terminal domain-containing protein n=1 Tax=Gimesia fumaroli TaxID=2527976 RepID=A0A518I9U7_9PLAN|nr:DUF4255 domain-containing protein [Gimesia fumaroli]QDV49887.1 hypothetical protein Enr17x_19080 [Gimesia fumaroli]